MAANFEIAQHNFHGFFDPRRCKIVHFRPWIQFLNQHCGVSFAICSNPLLRLEPLRLLCTTVYIAADNQSFSFFLSGTQYFITKAQFLQVMHFPPDNFSPLPTEQELIQFFMAIHHEDPLNITRLSKMGLVCEWDLLFDTLARVFANSTKGNFHLITRPIQIIGFSIVLGRRVDFGTLIWEIGRASCRERV